LSPTTTTGDRAGSRRLRRSLRLILIAPVAAVLALVMTPLTANAATAAVHPNTTCSQSSYVQLLTPTGNLLTPPNSGGSVSDPFYFNLDFNGVVQPGSSVVIVFTNTATGQVVNVPSNNWANGNCVLDQEPNVFSGARVGTGTWSVQAYFEPWEIGYYIYEPMGTLTLY
jgi:hypothetical protein